MGLKGSEGSNCSSVATPLVIINAFCVLMTPLHISTNAKINVDYYSKERKNAAL